MPKKESIKNIVRNLAYSYISSMRRKRDVGVGLFLCATVAIIMTGAIIDNYFREGMLPESGTLIINGLFYVGWLIFYFVHKDDSGRILIQPQNLKYVIIGIPLVFFLLVFLLHTYLEAHTTEEILMTNKHYAMVKNNLESIKNLPGAERQPVDDMDSMVKTNLVYVEAEFNSNASYDVIKRYYLDELISEGWDFVSEESEKDWGKDYGVKDLNFKKDEMKLALTYIPLDQQENYGYNFSVSIDLEF